METYQLPVKEAVSYGWNMAKSNFWFFFKVIFILLFVQIGTELLAYEYPFLAVLVSFVLQVILAMGLINVALALVDKKKVKVQDLWSVYRPFWIYLGAALLTGVGVVLGFVLFVIPGIYAALGWMFVSYSILDKNLGVIESMKRSWEITDGQRLRLLGLVISLWSINFIGILPLGIGLLWTIPTSLMAMAYVYRKLEMASSVATTK